VTLDLRCGESRQAIYHLKMKLNEAKSAF